MYISHFAKLYSWNILHINYELKYNNKDTSIVLQKNRTEDERMQEILDVITSNLTKKTIFFLQEVSSVFLEKLKILENEYKIFSLMREELENSEAEYLVTIVHKSFNAKIVSTDIPITFAPLILEIDSVYYVNIHLPYLDDNKKLVIDYVSRFDKFVIAGDANKHYSKVKELFTYPVKNIRISKPTRKFIRNGKIRYTSIDSIFVDPNLDCKYAKTFDNDSLSDHNIIMLRF